MGRTLAVLAAGLLLLSCNGSRGAGEDADAGGRQDAADAFAVDLEQARCEAPPAGEGLCLWYEDSDLTPIREALPFLAAHGLEVSVGLHEGEIDYDALEDFMRAACEAGVPVHIWPLIRYEDGYFPNVRTADRFAALWQDIVEQVERRALPTASFVVDLEPPIQDLLDVQSRFAAGEGPMAIVEHLRARFDATLWEEGRAVLAGLVDDAHERGLRVQATTLFLLLDDYADGDDDMQKVFDSPLDGIPWDEVSFQVYRSAFGDMLTGTLLQPGEMLSPRVVFDYATTAVEQLGERAGLDLGIVGQAGYTEPEALLEDIAAALAAGVPLGRVNVYSLQGLLDAGDGASSWVAVDDIVAEEPPADAKSTVLRGLLQGMDASVRLPRAPDPVEGYGAATQGGEGGPMVVVTSFANAGEGTLRQLLADADGPVNVSFGGDGEIALETEIMLPSFVTIDASGRSVAIRNRGFVIRDQQHVILRNLAFRDCGGLGGDSIQIHEGAHHVVVDHCSFDDAGMMPFEPDQPDEQISIIWGSTDVTISWCRFQNHEKVILIGNGDAPAELDEAIRVTMHHNFFRNTGRRHPFLRWGRVDMYNNVVADLRRYLEPPYGVRSAEGAEILCEANWFEQDDLRYKIAAYTIDDGRLRLVDNRYAPADLIALEREPDTVFERPYEANIDELTEEWRAMMESEAGNTL